MAWRYSPVFDQQYDNRAKEKIPSTRCAEDRRVRT